MTNKNIEPKPFKSLSHIIAFTLLFIVEQIPLSILTLTKKQLGASYSNYVRMAPYLSLFLMLIAGIILYLVYRNAQQFESKKFSTRTWITIVIGIIAAMAVNYGLIPFMRAQNSNTDALQIMGQNSKAILIFSVLVISPIFEELLFRGIMMNWFFANRPVISIILSGLIFGFAHAPISSNMDWVYAISKILLGIILALVYYRTKNIKASISVHFLNNLISVIGM